MNGFGLPGCLGIDHVIIGVSDLTSAIHGFRDAGFTVELGGEHPALGTHNALVAFRSGYVELLAMKNVPRGTPNPSVIPLIERTDRSDGLVGWAVESDDLEALATSLSSRQVDRIDLTDGRRHRDDGKVVRWRMLTIGGGVLGRALPFAVQWRTPRDERFSPAAVSHPNTASRLVGVRVRARDNAVASTLGLHRISTSRAAEPDAILSRYALGASTLELITGEPGSPTAVEVDRFGEGVCGVLLEVENINSTHFAGKGTELSVCGTPFRLMQGAVA